eukprot:1683602-Rhodomonas_salina.1
MFPVHPLTGFWRHPYLGVQASEDDDLGAEIASVLCGARTNHSSTALMTAAHLGESEVSYFASAFAKCPGLSERIFLSGGGAADRSKGGRECAQPDGSDGAALGGVWAAAFVRAQAAGCGGGPEGFDQQGQLARHAAQGGAPA